MKFREEAKFWEEVDFQGKCELPRRSRSISRFSSPSPSPSAIHDFWVNYHLQLVYVTIDYPGIGRLHVQFGGMATGRMRCKTDEMID